MFGNNKKVQSVDEIDTIVGPGTKFKGSIEAIGIVRVDGMFTGDISTKGDIIIGEKGNVEGNLNARNMIVAGISNAKLFCSEKLEIKSTGKVVGDVEVNSIIIEDKAVFEGKCHMRNGENVALKEAVNE